MASSSGAMPGRGLKPQSDSTAASIRPTVIRIRIPSASRQKILTICSGIFHRPSRSGSAAANTGRFCSRHSGMERPASRPPVSRPTGMAASPSMIPLAKKGLSSCRIIPMPTGMVKTRVQPKIAAATIPA